MAARAQAHAPAGSRRRCTTRPMSAQHRRDRLTAAGCACAEPRSASRPWPRSGAAVTSPGSIDEIRRRRRPSSAPISRTRSARSPCPAGSRHVPMLMPVRTSSRMPLVQPPPRVAQDRGARPALGGAAGAGDDAERAALVAAVLHLHEGPRAAAAAARRRGRRAARRSRPRRATISAATRSAEPPTTRHPGGGELVAVQVRGAPGHERRGRGPRGAVDLPAALALGLERQRAGVDHVHLGGARARSRRGRRRRARRGSASRRPG